MSRLLIVFLLMTVIGVPAGARETPPDLQSVLQENHRSVERASRRTVEALLQALTDSGAARVPFFLQQWRTKNVWMGKEDRRFYYVENPKADNVTLIDIGTGEKAGTAPRRSLKQLRPNSGVRGVLAAALVRYQLVDSDPAQREQALQAIERNGQAQHLSMLKAALAVENDAVLKARMSRLYRLVMIEFSPDSAARIKAIDSFSEDIGLDVRGALNPLLATRREAAPAVPDGVNIARLLRPGIDLTVQEAYDFLVEKKRARARLSRSDRDQALVDNITDGTVAGTAVATLNNDAARDRAYAVLAARGLVPAAVTEADMRAALKAYVIFDAYQEPDRAVTDAALTAIEAINTRVGWYQAVDLGLDALSLASIYFLAAIGLAITFGVMGVINMAHGEFIMIGAYTGYVVQLFIPDYTLSILVALPLAFMLAFGAGVALERLVIRYLMHRPLETLLATFGISIALQQLAKNIFGTQARPLTAPDWLDGAWVVNDIVSISLIRIAIFVLALVFLGVLVFILTRTRFGLEVRAVTQNPRMAASMGINPDRINMFTFGLGSGIAGIAGVAIGLFAKVTSELGSAYIVQSFMTVVVGGVGNIWGTLAGAGMIGTLQKIIEWLNPSNTLAAQTYMIIFIIIFIQFRPKGIIALKGRAAGD